MIAKQHLLSGKRVAFLTLVCVALSGVLRADGPMIFWKNGDSLAGEVLEAGPGHLVWDAALFDEPLRLAIQALEKVSVPAEATRPADAFTVNLVDGGRLFGEVTGLDEEVVSVESTQHGALKLRRDEVQAIYRIQGGELLWSGPFGDLGWEHPGNSVPPERRWRAVGGGGLRSVSWREPVALEVDLPDKVEFEVHLQSSKRPQFTLELESGGAELELVTWDDEVVVHRGNAFAAVMTLSKTDREATFRVYWDRKADRGMVCSLSGKVLARWAAADSDVERSGDTIEFPAAEGPADGDCTLTVTNQGADLELALLRIRRWDGGLPIQQGTRTRREDGIRVELRDGQILSGQPLRTEGEQLLVEGGESVELASVDAMVFRERPDLESLSGAGKGRVTLELEDGTRLLGKFAGIVDGEVSLSTSFSDAEVNAPLASLRALVFGEAEPAGAASEDEILTAAKQRLRGRWEPAEGTQPKWRTVGASNVVALKDASARATITRSERRETRVEGAPALFHLDTGEIAPGRWDGVEDEGEVLMVSSDFFSATRFPAERLSAVTFEPPRSTGRGFGDAGWTDLSTREGAVTKEKRNGDTVVTLRERGKWGHPSLLFGDSFEFKVEAGRQGYGGYRVRLFCDGVELSKPSTSFLLAHFGQQLRCGIEGDMPGQFVNQQQFPIRNDGNRIKFTWDGEKTVLFVDGKKAVEVDLSDEAPRAGLGVVIEAEQFYGRDVPPIQLSQAQSGRSPGYCWFPVIGSDARGQALMLPRFRRFRFPRQLIFAYNGDFLRGTILAADETSFEIRSATFTHRIERDLAAAAVWLSPPEDAELPSGGVGGEGDENTGEGVVDESVVPTHWLILRNGARLSLAVDSFGPEFVTGVSPLLGECRIPVDDIHSIDNGKPEPALASRLLAGWQLERAPEPDLAPVPGNSLRRGAEAPNFELPLLGEEEPFILEEERGKVLVLVFWASWSGPSVQLLPELLDRMAAFPADQVEVVAINQADQPAVITDFLNQRGLEGIEIVLDPVQEAGRLYNVENLPHLVVLDREGKVELVDAGYGFGTIDMLERTVTRAVEEEVARPSGGSSPSAEEGDEAGRDAEASEPSEPAEDENPQRINPNGVPQFDIDIQF